MEQPRIQDGEPPDAASSEAMICEIDVHLTSENSHSRRAGLRLNKAVLLQLLNRLEEAREQVEAALRDAPDDPSVQLTCDYFSGIIFHREQKYKEAFSHFSDLLRSRARQLQDPDNRFIYEDIQQYRAFEAAELRDYEHAIPLLREILVFDLKPEDRASALARLGIGCFQIKEYESARDYLIQASALKQPINWEGHIHFFLALSYANLKMLKEAKQEFLLCEKRGGEWGLSIRNVYGWLSRICKYLGENSQSKEYGRLARPD